MTIYCNRCWWSDAWDPKDYAMEYDFSKPFFTQYRELMQKIPHMAIVNDDGIASVNCEYTHDNWFSKNCYMFFSSWRIENGYYSFLVNSGKDIIDCLNLLDANERVYECTSCEKSYNLKKSQFSISCVDSAFLYDCRGCTDCFMCAGLRNKKYCFQNKQYDKEAYEKILKEYRLDTFSGVERAQREYDEFILKYPRRYAYITQSLNCTGDVLTNSKNTRDSFGLGSAENCRFYDYGFGPTDSYDMSMSGELSECYESVIADHSHMNRFGVFSVKSQDIQYCQHCHSSKHLFGCSQLRSAEYCILNKQYSKEEYEILVKKIIDQMNALPYVDQNGCTYRYGEFYPIEQSPFGYNETVALDQIPISREEALMHHFKWCDTLQITTGKETLKSEQLPDSIRDVSDAMINEIFVCISCGRNYRIVLGELNLYRLMNIPIPRRCFQCRHHARILRRNPLELWHRACACKIASHKHTGNCKNEFETSYAPDRKEIIYCEECYQKEIA